MSSTPGPTEVDAEKNADSKPMPTATHAQAAYKEGVDYASPQPADPDAIKAEGRWSPPGSMAMRSPRSVEHSDLETTERRPSRRQAWLTNLRPKRSTEVRGRYLDASYDGYPHLATFKSSDNDFAIYRRFGYLQARLLLNKQDQLRVLEHRLDQLDATDAAYSNTRNLPAHKYEARETLLLEIEEVFTSYANLLLTSQCMLASNRPTSSETRSVRSYIHRFQPLVAEELEYILHHEDLVTLRPGRDHALLDRWIECPSSRPESATTGTFRRRAMLTLSQMTRMKASGDVIAFSSRERVEACASLITLLVIVALIIVPLYPLYRVVRSSSDKDRILDENGIATCIGILLGFTFLFSAVLSVFTRAMRHEIFGATAVYCAVLVVFLGNVPAR